MSAFLYRFLLSIRPTQLGELIKTILGIKRFNLETSMGQLFYIDPVSNFGFNLLSKGIYEPQMTQLLYLLLRDSDTFIDIGGNEGYFSIIASSLVKNSLVHLSLKAD
ncbi:hypothetical protein ACN4EE_08150 [Geminocystis sp. CENA526]|uniref:hypothetical protein n=1 Tax=Geminocystis sp. CENA526 TaxID=1355871 RepID=UPI003D6E0DF5